jgi:sensor histidine kinase YesM
MKHPLTNNYQLLLAYAVFWAIIGILNAILQVFWYDVLVQNAILDAVSTYILYPILGTSIWYSIKYNSLEEVSVSRLILFNLVAATLLSGVWIYFTFTIFKIFSPERTEFLYSSLPAKILAGYIMYMVMMVFFYALMFQQNFKEKIKREAELKALIREAELQALKSQINPHFLFNSLNSISSLTISNPEKAQEMVINLSNFMRYSLQHGEKEKVLFSRELENSKLYLSIEKVRFGRKLNPEFQIDVNCLDAEIPNMILQPLYENAIKYGVYETTDQVTILTKSECDGKNLIISIINDYDPDSMKKRGEGIGLRNIRQRLEIIYGNPDLMKVTDSRTRFEVQITIPQIQAEQ